MKQKHLDLDARRAARREAASEPVSFTFGGETFDLPVEMPVAAIELVAGVDVEALSDEQAVGLIVPILRALLGPEQWARFSTHSPTLEDVSDLSDYIWESYGISPQTPSQSPPSARATGARSKPTSKRRTASTPARSSAAR